MAGVLHSEVPQSARWTDQVLPILVEIGAGVEWAEWNWWRTLQEVIKEWIVRGLCKTKRSGPRVGWLLGRKNWLSITFWLKSKRLPLALCPKELSVWWGGLPESVTVIESYRRKWGGKEGGEREFWREVEQFGDGVGHQSHSSWEFRNLLALVHL
jgi:hypothetical protein